MLSLAPTAFADSIFPVDVKVIWRQCVAAFAMGFKRWEPSFFGEHGLKGQPTKYSGVQCVSRNSSFRRPFRNGKCFASIGDAAINSLVILLNRAGSPSTVIGFISSLVVNSIYARIWWSGAHVREELAERAPPSADRDAPRPVVFIVRIFRVITTLPDVHPDRVLSCFAMPVHIFVRHAVRGSLPRHFLSQAATRSGRTSSKVVCPDGFFIPARAAAEKLFRVLRANRNYCQPTKSLPQHVLPPVGAQSITDWGKECYNAL